MFSPNGRWVAYKGPERKVWVRPFAGRGSVGPASLDRGFTRDPKWSWDGRELFFATPSDEWPGWKLEAIEFREVGPDFVFGDTRIVGSFDVLGYAPKPDGKGFILAERRREFPGFTVVVNLARWLRDLEG
jgi:hypothetical protein